MRETEREKNVSGEESKASNRQECQMRVGAQLSPSQDGLKGESQRERERDGRRGDRTANDAKPLFKASPTV